VNRFNVVYQQFIAMYNSGCQISCNWSRLKLGFKLLAHQITIPQINMIPHPITLTDTAGSTRHAKDKHDTPPSTSTLS